MCQKNDLSINMMKRDFRYRKWRKGRKFRIFFLNNRNIVSASYRYKYGYIENVLGERKGWQNIGKQNGMKMVEEPMKEKRKGKVSCKGKWEWRGEQWRKREGILERKEKQLTVVRKKCIEKWRRSRMKGKNWKSMLWW